tara:strand:+ start:772 stop:1650 length:879 start_codon:yes stop_codon:yes gene_type:complete
MDLERACNILNVTYPISLSDIKKKYYRAALSCHPDRNSDTNSTAAFQELNDAYNFLCMHLEVEQDEIIKEDDRSYISIIERFINIMIGSNYEQDTIYNIINGCKNLSVKAFENIDKRTALKVFGYIELFAESLKIDEKTIESIKEIIKNKLKDDKLYILNPSIDNLLNGDIYILNYDEDTYYIPMWHDEITYDISDISLIVKCIPDIPKHMYLDENNSLHINITTSISKLLDHKQLSVQIGKKVFDILTSELKIMKYQTYKLYNVGIPLLNTSEIFTFDKKGDIIFHLELNK